MAKFNEVQKKRRAIISESKRARHGDPNTRKLKQKVQPLAISGKRKRKLVKKWRRVCNHLSVLVTFNLLIIIVFACIMNL